MNIYKLDQDLVLEESLDLSEYDVLDLNNYIITSPSNGYAITTSKDLTVKNGQINGYRGIHVHDGGHVIVSNIIMNLEGRGLGIYGGSSAKVLKDSQINTASVDPCIFILGDLSVSGGTTSGSSVDVYGSLICDKGSAISGNGSDKSPSEINIYEGSILKSNIDVGIYVPSGNSVLNIFGGDISGNTAIYAKEGSVVNIDGGTISAFGDTSDWRKDTSGCYPTGDAIVVDSCRYTLGNAPSLNITGGTISSENGNTVANYKDSTAVAEPDVQISGGDFSPIPSEDYLDANLIDINGVLVKVKYDDIKFSIRQEVTSDHSDDDQHSVIGNRKRTSYLVLHVLYSDMLSTAGTVDADLQIISELGFDEVEAGHGRFIYTDITTYEKSVSDLNELMKTHIRPLVKEQIISNMLSEQERNHNEAILNQYKELEKLNEFQG